MSARFEDKTIQLLSLNIAPESTFEDPRLHEAWNRLSGRATEIVQSTHAGLYDFMDSDRCLYIAAIMQKPFQDVLDEYDQVLFLCLPTDLVPPPPQHELVGIIYATSTDTDGTLDIALAVCAHAQGGGHGARAVRLLLGWAFGELRVHRVQARVIDFEDDSADAAQQLLTALGFVREGTARRALLCHAAADAEPAAEGAGGLWRDVVTFALLDTDWTMQAVVRPGVKSMWDAMFVRHEREQEAHVRMEERAERRRRQRVLAERAAQAAETDGAPPLDQVPVVFRPPPPQSQCGLGAWVWESEAPGRTTPSRRRSPSPASSQSSQQWAGDGLPLAVNWHERAFAQAALGQRFTQTPWAELFNTPYEGGTPEPGTPYESADEAMAADDADADTASTVSSLSTGGHFSDGELVSDAESAASVPRSASVLSDASAASSWFDSWEELADGAEARSEVVT